MSCLRELEVSQSSGKDRPSDRQRGEILRSSSVVERCYGGGECELRVLVGSFRSSISLEVVLEDSVGRGVVTARL